MITTKYKDRNIDGKWNLHGCNFKDILKIMDDLGVDDVERIPRYFDKYQEKIRNEFEQIQELETLEKTNHSISSSEGIILFYEVFQDNFKAKNKIHNKLFRSDFSQKPNDTLTQHDTTWFLPNRMFWKEKHTPRAITHNTCSLLRRSIESYLEKAGSYNCNLECHLDENISVLNSLPYFNFGVIVTPIGEYQKYFHEPTLYNYAIWMGSKVRKDFVAQGVIK